MSVLLDQVRNISGNMYKPLYEWKFNEIIYVYLYFLYVQLLRVISYYQMHLAWDPSKDSSIKSL